MSGKFDDAEGPDIGARSIGADAESFEVRVPGARIIAARDARLLEIARNLNRALPPDVIPETIRERFGSAVLAEVMEAAAKEAAARALALHRGGGQHGAAIEALEFDEVRGMRLRIRAPEASTATLSQGGSEVLPDTAAPAGPSVDVALKALAESCATWEKLPPGAVLREGDRVTCDIRAWVLEECPDPDVPRLLSGLDAAPATLPRGWWLAVPEGIAASVAGTGRDYGLSFVDIRFSGRGLAQQQIAVRFAGHGSIPTASAGKLHLRLPMRCVRGEIPAAGRSLLTLDQFAEGLGYVVTSTSARDMPGSGPLVGAMQDAVFEVSTQARSVVPGLTIWLNADTALDFTLRLGEPVLSACMTVSLPCPEEAAQDVTMVLGEGEDLSQTRDMLIGARIGEERRMRGELQGWAGRMVSVFAKAGERKVAPAIDDALARRFGHPSLRSLMKALEGKTAIRRGRGQPPHRGAKRPPRGAAAGGRRSSAMP